MHKYGYYRCQDFSFSPCVGSEYSQSSSSEPWPSRQPPPGDERRDSRTERWAPSHSALLFLQANHRSHHCAHCRLICHGRGNAIYMYCTCSWKFLPFLPPALMGEIFCPAKILAVQCVAVSTSPGTPSTSLIPRFHSRMLLMFVF